MKSRTILLFFLGICSVLNAQVKNVEFKTAANTTFINSVTKDLNPAIAVPIIPSTGYSSTTINLGTIKESYKSSLGFDAGISFQIAEYKNFFLCTGLGIQYLRFHRSTSIENQPDNLFTSPGGISNPGFPIGYPYGLLNGSGIQRDADGNMIINVDGFPTGQGQPFGANPNIGKTSTLYLQLPISIGRTFFSEKLMVSANMQAQFLAQAAVVVEEYAYTGIKENKDKSGDGFKNTLFTLGVEIAYKIIKPLAVSISYNRGLTPIYDEGSQVAGKTFYNNVSLGINYSISK